MKNFADLGGCYPPRPSASVDNTLLDLQNSYPTQPHSIIANSEIARSLSPQPPYNNSINQGTDEVVARSWYNFFCMGP